MSTTPQEVVDIPARFADRLEYNAHAHKNGVDQRKNPGVQVHHKYQYYADRKKRWPFFTDKFGAQQLIRLLEATEKCLDICQHRLDEGLKLVVAEESSPTPPTEADMDRIRQQILQDGEDIYSEKKNLKVRYVTWSQKEYDHPGFQHWYLKLKSIQRYTETYVLAQRLHRVGYFAKYIEQDRRYASELKISSTSSTAKAELNEDEPVIPDDDDDNKPTPPEPFICVSLGGGPAFEILAIQHFFETICPSTPFIGYSLDLNDCWKEYVEAIGLRFATWDGNQMGKGDTIQAALQAAGHTGTTPIDMCLISYAFLMYMSTPEHQKDLFSILIDYGNPAAAVTEASTGTRADVIVISERAPRMAVIKSSERDYSVHIHRLVRPNDDRQLLIYKNSKETLQSSSQSTSVQLNAPHFSPSYETQSTSLLYPNVPYEDNMPSYNNTSNNRGRGQSGGRDNRGHRDNRDNRDNNRHDSRSQSDRSYQGGGRDRADERSRDRSYQNDSRDARDVRDRDYHPPYARDTSQRFGDRVDTDRKPSYLAAAHQDRSSSDRSRHWDDSLNAASTSHPPKKAVPTEQQTHTSDKIPAPPPAIDQSSLKGQDRFSSLPVIPDE